MIREIFAGSVLLGHLICFMLVLVKMFQKGKTGLAVVCAGLGFVGLIGCLVAFVYGWFKQEELGARNLMTIWAMVAVANVVIVLGWMIFRRI